MTNNWGQPPATQTTATPKKKRLRRRATVVAEHDGLDHDPAHKVDWRRSR